MVKRISQLVEDRNDLGANAPISTPYVVYIESSSFCNLACKFCPHFIDPEKINKTNMSPDVFLKICSDLTQFPEKIKLMRFCGLGDSLMNKSFPSFVETARRLNVADRYELITNGILLRRENREILARELDRIIISVEGLNEQDYVDFTNRKIKFKRFVKAVESLRAVSGRRAKLHIKIHNSAVQTDEKKQEFFRIFQPLADEIFVENLINLWPEVESNLGLDSGHRFVNARYRGVEVCAQIFKSLQVNADGSVFPCCIDWRGVNNLGNVLDTSLLEIWGSQKLSELRMLHLEGKKNTHAPCSGCDMNELSDIDFIDDHADQIIARMKPLATA